MTDALNAPRQQRPRRRPQLLPLVLTAVLATVPAVAQVPNVSEPATAFPLLPETLFDGIQISDLNETPPVARRAVVQLTMLGVYPLSSGRAALPNEILDGLTAASMIVNAFAPHAAGQYPVPAAAAFIVLSVLTGSVPSPDAPVDVGTYRDLVVTVVDAEVGLGPAVAAALDERYPALAAGNPRAPLTRAGAALMTAIALETLERLTT
jgi:hypothetical protein